MRPLTPAMTEALTAIRADAKRKGSNRNLVHGTSNTRIQTLWALQDRGYIRLDGVRETSYTVRGGMFGRGNYRTETAVTFNVTLVGEI